MAKSKTLGVRKNENVDVLCYRFAALPTNEQIIQLNKTIGCCRYLWNRMLGDHNTLYQEIGVVPNNTPADYKSLEECLWLKEVDSLALANVQLNLNQAFQKFFNGEASHPRFKKKKVCKDSFTTNNVSGNVRMEGKGIRLPKLGILTLIRHRKVKAGGKLKSVTVCHEKDGKWYCSISFEYPKTEPVYPEPSEDMKHIGLDMSAPHLYVDSNGELADFEKPYKKLQEKLAQEQRKLSHRQKDSKNYEKQRKVVARLHAKIKHQRKDRLHKLSEQLTREYDLISVEDLDMSALKQTLNLGKSYSDNGWGMFVTMLLYKGKRNGCYIIKINGFHPVRPAVSADMSTKNCGFLTGPMFVLSVEISSIGMNRQLSTLIWKDCGYCCLHKMEHLIEKPVGTPGLAFITTGLDGRSHPIICHPRM